MTSETGNLVRVEKNPLKSSGSTGKKALSLVPMPAGEPETSFAAQVERIRRGYLARHGRLAEPGHCSLCGADARGEVADHLQPAIGHLRAQDPEGVWCEVCLSRAFAFICHGCGSEGHPLMDLHPCPECGRQNLCFDCLPQGTSRPCGVCGANRDDHRGSIGQQVVSGPGATVRAWILLCLYCRRYVCWVNPG